jgi:hypothetical protein
MRDLDTIDSELRLLAAVRWSIREHGGEPSSRQVDELLDPLSMSAPMNRARGREGTSGSPVGSSRGHYAFVYSQLS